MSVAAPVKDLELYGKLTSSNSETRIEAAANLLDRVLKEQSGSTNLCNEATYVLRKTILGLTSRNGCARQGFCLVLTGLLSRLEIGLDVVLDLLNKEVDLGKVSKQQKREYVFGRIFCYNAVVDSSLIKRAQNYQDAVYNIVSDLCSLAKFKNYMECPAYHVIIKILSLQGDLDGDFIAKITRGILPSGIKNENDLWISIALQNKYNIDWKSVFPLWGRDGLALCNENVESLVEILKSTTKNLPTIHPIWDLIINKMMDRSKDSKITLEVLWPFLDKVLFGSPPEKKYLGFELISRILDKATPDEVEIILSDNWYKCLTTALNKKHEYLYQCAKKMASVVSRISKERPELSHALIMRLNGKDPNANFDVITKTKTIENILMNISSDSVKENINFYENVFLNADLKDEQFESKRIFMLENLMRIAMISNPSFEDEARKRIMRFMVTYILFEITGNTQDIKVPKNSITFSTRRKALNIFVKLIKTLYSRNRVHSDLWDLINYIKTLDDSSKQSDKIKLYSEMDSETEQLWHKLHSTSGDIRISVSEGKFSHLWPVLDLFTYITVMLHFEPKKFEGSLDDLIKSISFLKNPSSKSEGINTEINPIEVLTDIILSFISIPSAFLRHLSENLLKAFINDINLNALKLILSAIAEETDSDYYSENSSEKGSEMSDEDSEAGENELFDFPIDEAANKKLKISHEESQESDDINLSDADEDEIALLDSKISRILRLNRESKLQIGENLRSSLRFKLCAADLLGVFFKNSSGTSLKVEIIEPLLSTLKAAKKSKIAGLKGKLLGIINKAYGNSKNLPKVSPDICTRALAITHKHALSFSDADSNKTYSIISIYLVRTISLNSSDKSYIDVYKDTFMKSIMVKKSKIRLHFFESLINEKLGLGLLPLFADILFSDIPPFKVVTIARLISIMLKNVPKHLNNEQRDLIISLENKFREINKKYCSENLNSTEPLSGSRKKPVKHCLRVFYSKLDQVKKAA